MHLNLQSAQPIKSFKRSLESIDPDYLLASKHRRGEPLLSPSAPVDTCQAQRPSSHTSQASPQQTTKRKRLLDFSDYTSSKKQRQLSTPNQSSLNSSIFQWLSQLPRVRDTRLKLLYTNTSLPTIEPAARSCSLAYSVSASLASSTNGRPSTSDLLYRSVIKRNFITLDPVGKEIEPEIRELLDTYILKERDSPRLTGIEVSDVVDLASHLLNSAEAMVSDLVGTKAFPIKRHGIAEGRNSQWTTDALPSNPEYVYRLAAPKTDCHYGYPIGFDSDWTDKEVGVAEHRTVQPYSSPTRANLFPFFMLEIKSESTGGSLYAAENQAVGSGVHSVRSLRWLLSQAFPSKAPAATDAVAFTVAISSRFALFYVVWYSAKKDRYIMSKFMTVCLLDGLEKPEIQKCRDVTENVLDYGLDIRQEIIKGALAELHPFPEHWKKSRPASSVTETPLTSLATEEMRSNKTRKKS